MNRRKKGSGTIENMPDGRKLVRISTAAGRRRLGAVDTREEAEALLDAVRGELLEREHIEGLTLADWGRRYLDRRETEGIRGIATERYAWRLHIERSALADLPLASITRRDIIDWLDVMCAKRAADRRGSRRLSRMTIQNTLNLLRGAIEAAVQRDIIGSNPAAGIKVPRRVAPTREPWTFLTLEEQQAIARCRDIPEAHRVMIAFAIGTGLRLGEMMNLELADLQVDGPHPEVVVRYGSKGKGPKNAKIRHVPLFSVGLEAARRWLELLPDYAPANPHRLVFPGPTGARRARGKHLHTTRVEEGVARKVDLFKEHLRAAAIARRVRWHDLRHTCAASLVSGLWGRRWSLEEVKGLLGHSSVTVTERYAHLADSALRAAATATTLLDAACPEHADQRHLLTA